MPARLLNLAALLVLAALAPAQGGAFIPSTIVSLDMASGAILNPTSVTAAVWAEPVSLPGASSFRLRFGSVDLQDPLDVVVVTGVLDGQVQRLGRNAIRAWEGMTGWFNGSAAIVSLELAPGSAGSVQVVAAEALGGTPIPELVCGGDNRLPGGDAHVFRMLIPVAGGVRVCTGFLVSNRSTYVTAGRCFRDVVPNMTAEFNVPDSTNQGSIVHPPIQDQFAGDPTTVLSDDRGPGENWAVGRLHPNNTGQTAAARFGHFQLPPFVSVIATEVRLSGYGFDQQLTRVHTLQSDVRNIGWIALGGSAATNPINHELEVDDGGSFGSPLVDTNLGFPLGIHVHHDCPFPLVITSIGNHKATSIYNAQLQAAIAATNGCSAIHLLNDSSSTVPCTPTVYDCDTDGGRWNLVAVTSASDWSIHRETLASSLAGGKCNFLLANGNLGEVPPISGEIRRSSGSATARAQFVVAQAITPGQSIATTWASTRVVRAFQFDAPGTSAASFSVNVSGDPSLSWHLYGPSPSTGSGWIPRGASSLVASGAVGGAPLLGIPSSAPGQYCLVVFRDGGAATPAPASLTVTVATGPLTNVPVPQGALRPIPAGTTTFSLSPAAGVWNAVAVPTAGDYALSLGSGVSSLTVAGRTEFVVANGHNGAISPVQGIVSSAAGAPPAAIEHVLESGPGFQATTVFSSNVGAGHALKVTPFTVIGIGGFTRVTVTGDASLRWHLFDGRPGAGSRWRGPSEALGSGPVGGGQVLVDVPPGTHALVVVRQGDLTSSDLPFTAQIGSSNVTLPGPGTFVGGLTLPHYSFTCTPQGNRWTAIGAASSILSSHALFIGSASSAAPPSTNAYVIANGNLGPVAPVDGIVTRSSSANLISGGIYQASASSVNVGTPGSMNWSQGIGFHIFEFQVTTSATYNLSVSGAGVVDWALFRPGVSGVWRSKAQGELLSPGGTVQTGVLLQPGPHAIAVSFGAGASAGSTITCTVTLDGNLPPALASVTPGSVIAGSPGTTLVISGSFLAGLNGPGTTIEWDDSIPLGIVSRTSGMIVAVLPASLVAAPGNHSIRAVNPAPGGGPSASVPFLVRRPRIVSVSPAALPVFTPGSASVQLTISGTDFLPGAVVHAGEHVLPTTIINSGQLLALIGGQVAELNVPGGVGLTVENGHFAQSNTVAVTVGAGSTNRGTNVRYPLEPLPGESYSGIVDGGPPGGLFSLIADAGNPAPITAWPSPAVNLVLGISSPAMFPVLDGFGLLGPAFPGAVYAADPTATAPGGTYTIPGFIWPQSPLNIRLSLQTINLDPSQPLGFGLGWTRIEDL